MSKLFSPLKIRSLEFKNRLFVSPMCQYSSIDGLANDWHMVHLGSRAVGGAALVFTEATAVSAVGRISPSDMGIWSDAHANAFKPITKFIRSQNAYAGIQLAHAGRKASTKIPWEGDGAVTEGGWEPLAPSSQKFSDTYPQPKEMTLADMKSVADQFAAAAKRSLDAGFSVAEIHAAHGYLVHEFLSPLSNERRDNYGGSLENRARFPLEVARAVRETWPANLPVFARISATDWTENGWDVVQSVQFAKWLKEIGVDFIDVSSGGNVAKAKIPIGPGYQVPFAAQIRREAEILTGSVGLITTPQQAEEILSSGQADAILMAREFLRDPYFGLHAAAALGDDAQYPKQYARAKPK
jgi:2,4-dienoyl-CoA reductase-like NADH-dependent reductase (Old Yellow Enzyme family)